MPDEGDIIWVSFDPQLGREQAGHRPAVVLTQAYYNRRMGLAICCPITSRIKGYPFEVLLTGSPPSAALVDHARSLDWRARRIKPKGGVTARELRAIRQMLADVIGYDTLAR